MRPENVPLLSPRKLEEFSALEFLEYVKSMRKIPESKTRSKLVEGINISNDKKLIVKIDKKRISIKLSEIMQLAQEFEVKLEILIEKFQKRKILILGEDENELVEYRNVPKQRKSSGKRKKRNDVDSNGESTDSSKDKLFKFGSSPNLQEES